MSALERDLDLRPVLLVFSHTHKVQVGALKACHRGLHLLVGPFPFKRHFDPRNKVVLGGWLLDRTHADSMTCEMRNTGDYKVMEVADFPILMVRVKIPVITRLL